MESKKAIIFFIVGFILYRFLCYSPPDNPIERNSISFKDNIDSVSIAIKKMNDILDDSNVRNYFFYYLSSEDNKFYISNKNRRKLDLSNNTALHKSEHLLFLEEDKRKEFIELAFYLESNKLRRCANWYGMYLYSYKNSKIDMKDRSEDLQRFIVYTEDARTINLKDFMILEKKDNLFLLANKGAEIYHTSRKKNDL